MDSMLRAKGVSLYGLVPSSCPLLKHVLELAAQPPHTGWLAAALWGAK